MSEKKWLPAHTIISDQARNQLTALAREKAIKHYKIDLRGWQAEAIADICLNRDVIVSAGTGSGKSMVFQCLPYMRKGGIVLVISPLLSLMHDQVCASIANGEYILILFIIGL